MEQETPTHADRKDLPAADASPASVEDVLSSLRGVLDSMARAQDEGRRALESAVERLDSIRSAPAPAPSRVVAVDRRRREPALRSDAPRRVHGRDETTTQPDDPVGTWLQPAPWKDPRTRPDVDETTTHSTPVETPPDASRTPSPAGPARASTAETSPARSTELRHAFVGLQRRAHELDRLETPEAIQAFLWDLARQSGVRGMLLQEKGRALYAEDAFHFDNFAGDRRARLRKVVVPYDPDGLFGAAAQDRAPYSGPRPARGLPVDLILVMGKQAPDWCLVVPMPYRNRWGTFLYFDATGEHLDSLLELEVVARLAVLQLRAARYRQHEPADRIRAFRSATLRDRKRKKAVRRGSLSGDAEANAESTGEDAFDPLSKKKRAGASLTAAVDADRFDADGNLVRPLDGSEILARIGELPSMPHVATRLIGLLNDPETEIRQLQEILSTDQSISVRLLQIANSSLYGNMREVSNIGEAIVRLGFTAIRSWLLSTVTRQLFVGDGSNAATMELWRQSVLCAMAAELIAEREGLMDPEVAFVGGLLQNIGLLVVARSHGEVFAEIDTRARAAEQSYVELERRVLGFDHADIGGILLQRWGLGESLVTAVSAHHRVMAVRTDDDRFAAVIALAEELALRLGGGPTETREDDLAEHDVATRLGIGAEALQEIGERLAERALDRELFEV